MWCLALCRGVNTYIKRRKSKGKILCTHEAASYYIIIIIILYVPHFHGICTFYTTCYVIKEFQECTECIKRSIELCVSVGVAF